LENELEKITFGLFPEIGIIKEKMIASGYELVMMSGSGSAVYGITGKTGAIYPSSRRQQLATLFPALQVTVTRTLGRENYFKRIGAWPSGKAPVFGAGIRRFESSRPSIF
jgi:4-diphosphocytidyl-2C-methyl-D-erythritol kinase